MGVCVSAKVILTLAIAALLPGRPVPISLNRLNFFEM